MTIRELKLFLHLAGSLHFGRTSQACNITPSGLSRAMQRLETELGHQLFIRNKRSVHLTPAGRIFRVYAEESIHRWNRLQSELNRDNILRGELTVYCSVTAILSILPEIFSRFRQAHPQVQLHLETGDAALAISKLHHGEADISVAAMPDRLPGGLDFIELISTPLIFIAAASTDIGSSTDDQLAIDWPSTPIIVAERGPSRERVDRWFEQKGIRPNIYSQVAGNEAIIAMVGMGCGIGVVPQLVLEQSLLKQQVRTLDVNPSLTPFSVGICITSRSRQNPAVEAFWNIATSAEQG